MIDLHSSVDPEALEREATASLQANQIDPKFLYVTPHQAELWRKVFLRHSPIHENPEFARIYRDAFAKAAEVAPLGKIALVGLGCGTGLKEAELCVRLKARGREVTFSAIDVSYDLVVESAQKLTAAGAVHERSLVCDLAEEEFLADWLGQVAGDAPRLITFFGLVPNLAPSVVLRLFRAVLRPGDVLLCSAHLAPVSESTDLSQAMHQVLPQYDNPETLAWLAAALEEWGLQERVETPRMNIGEIEGVPAFVAQARWKRGEPFERWGHRFSPKIEEPLQLFHSLRYTPPLFEQLLRNAGFNVELLAQTACREEAIWAINAFQNIVPIPDVCSGPS
jgi:L-histidine N-alpha-methyltransferase